MLISDKEAVARLNSPLNLMNLKGNTEKSSPSRNRAMSLFGIGENKTSPKVSEEKPLEEKPSEEKPAPLLNTTFVNPFNGDSAKELSKALEKVSSSTSVNTKPATVVEEKSNTNITEQSNSSQSPSVDDLIDNTDGKIKLAKVHNTALEVMHTALEELKIMVPSASVKQLPSILATASRVVTDIRKERIEANKTSKDREVHYHFYTPERKKLSDFEVIDVEPSVNPAA